MWQKHSGQLFSILMAFWLCGGAAMADEELPLPRDKTVCSPSGVYCADIRVTTRQTTVRKGAQEIWSMPGWYGDAYLADDGDHFVAGYWGYNLLDLKAAPNTTMLTFWRRGEGAKRCGRYLFRRLLLISPTSRGQLPTISGVIPWDSMSRAAFLSRPSRTECSRSA